MPTSIYPPTLQSTQSAFLANTSEYFIYFSLQSFTSYSEIGHVQIRIVKQSNNKSIVNTTAYPDGVIYKSRDSGSITVSGSNYRVRISSTEDLAETWQAGYLYKIQMRFGTSSTLWTDSNKEFINWKSEEIDNQNFSEWSNVMVIKAINAPSIYIQNAEAVREGVVSTQHTEATLMPLFSGIYSIDSSSNELEDKYRFCLYTGQEAAEANLLEDSGWLQHNGNVNTPDTYRFKSVLTSEIYYTVTYEIETVNGYTTQAEDYIFQALLTYLDELEGITLVVDDSSTYCSENGCINLYLTSTTILSGCYVITRSSEDSNYAIWENLAYYVYSAKTFNNTLIHSDFIIESGKKYKYAIQLENSAGLRSAPLYEAKNNARMVDFEYSYLYRDGVQLKLMFNQKLSSFKHTTLTTKQDTLGDTYPHLVRNGHAYYAEFPITGTISYQMDEDQTFFTQGTEGMYYGGELAIPADKFSKKVGERNDLDEKLVYQINSNLVSDNIFVERKFREKAEEFLNDFNYKLFKSPTEGNIVVGLVNVSLTPNSTVNRMIYDFSATAYEVMDGTLEELDEIGIINIGEFDTIDDSEITVNFGQIVGLYTDSQLCLSTDTSIVTDVVSLANLDVYAQIKAQEEISVGNGYKMQLENLRAIWVEGYPITDCKDKLAELEAQKSELLNNDEDVTEVEAEIEKYERLALALQGPTAVTTIINVNGTDIVIMPNRVYWLHETIYTLKVVSAPSPIIVNYVCDLTQVVDKTIGVTSTIDASRIWGQVFGVFTGTDKVLKSYYYDYGPDETPYRVYSNTELKSGGVSSGGDYDDKSLGMILIDNTTYNVYKTINLLDIIKEETRKQVEYIYNVSGGFYLDENNEWTDGSLYYTFSNIIEFDIEADEGTVMNIGQSADGSDAVPVRIGSTCRYTLNPMEGMVRYISLQKAQFAIINYKCLTTQERKKYD